MPLDWSDGIDRHRALWEKAEAQHYNPNTDIEWDALDPNDFTPDERVALAYWFGTNAVFENSGTPTFALGLIKASEEHIGDATTKMLLTVARDEANHDEMSRRIVQRLLPGFPHAFSPSNDLERAAHRNLRWIEYTNSRYWSSFKRAFDERRLLALMSNFAVGEAAGAVIFSRTGRQSEHPVFANVLQNIGVDESRHFACFNFMAEESWGSLSDEEKATLAKNLKASYLYISVIFGEPQQPFWDVPDGFRSVHRSLQSAARDAGLGLVNEDEQIDVWRKAMLRVKATADRHDVPYPTIEALDIDGEDTPISAEDLVVISF